MVLMLLFCTLLSNVFLVQALESEVQTGQALESGVQTGLDYGFYSDDNYPNMQRTNSNEIKEAQYDPYEMPNQIEENSIGVSKKGQQTVLDPITIPLDSVNIPAYSELSNFTRSWKDVFGEKKK